MTRKAERLPDIEDATFVACLDSLAAAVTAGTPRRDTGNPVAPPRFPPAPVSFPTAPPANVPPRGATPPDASEESSRLPSLAAWRSQADEEFAELRAVDRFLSATDAELAAAWQDYPRQIIGFLARVSRIQQRRAAQDHALATMMMRIQTTIQQATFPR